MRRIHSWKQFNSSISQFDLVKESSEDQDSYSEAANKKIKKARLELIIKSPFFGDLALKLQMKEDRNLRFKTMATDGLNIYYDPKFVTDLPIEEIKWVICHEIMHCVLQHFLRKQADPLIWNAACDYALNQRISGDPSAPDAYGKMPKIALGAEDDKCPDKKKFIGKSAEWIYQYMIENSTQIPPEEGWNYGGVEPPRKIVGKPGGKSGGGKGGGGGSKPKGRVAKIGDYVSLPGGGWGKVQAIDPANGDCDVTPMTEAEVRSEIESLKGAKIKSIK